MRYLIIILLLASCGKQDPGGGTVFGDDVDAAIDRCGPQGVDFFTIHNGEPDILYCKDGRWFEKYRWIQ